MDQKNFKELIVQKIRTSLEPKDEIHALWLGGSQATKRDDNLSDSDIVIISSDKNLPFKLIEQTLPEITQIYVAYDGPYNQRFYVLADTPETYYLDVVVFSDLNEEAYREYFNESRHGRPVVLFDKSQLLQQASQSPKTVTFSLDIKNEQAKF